MVRKISVWATEIVEGGNKTRAEDARASSASLPGSAAAGLPPAPPGTARVFLLRTLLQWPVSVRMLLPDSAASAIHSPVP
jgi:hypothetical protein